VLSHADAGFSSNSAGLQFTHFVKSGIFCRLTRQLLPGMGKFCRAMHASRQRSPGLIFLPRAKSMLKRF
jgi:hypothetical protein